MQPVQTIDVDTGETIGYRVREGGEIPVLLVHGNMTSSRHWDLVFEEMDEAFSLYAVDLRGFGASSYEERVDSHADFAADLAAFADRVIDEEQFHIWAWSTGAGPAVLYAADHPERVSKLVLMAPLSTRGYPIYRKDETGQPTDEVLTTREEIAADPVQVVPVLQAYENEDTDTLRAIWEALIYTDTTPDEERYEAYLEDMLTQRNLVDVNYVNAHFNVSDEATAYGEGSGRANDVTHEALVLRGDRDLVITAEMATEVVEDIPNATFVELADCGHSPMVDDLEALLGAVEPFLREG